MQQWYSKYEKQLEKQPSAATQQEVDALFTDGWKSRLGERDMRKFPIFLRYFELELRRLGSVRSLINEYLPPLLIGGWVSAFHCIIDLGWAIWIGNEKAVLLALAYWASAYVVFDDSLVIKHNTSATTSSFILDTATTGLKAEKDGKSFEKKSSKFPPSSTSSRDEMFIWDVLRDMRDGNKDLQRPAPAAKERGLTARILLVRDDTNKLSAIRKYFNLVQEHLNVAYPDNQSLEHWCNDTVWKLFRNSVHAPAYDFFFLHLITAFHSIRLILPFIEDPSERRRVMLFFVYCILLLFVVQGMPAPNNIVHYGNENNKNDESNRKSQQQERWKRCFEKSINYEDEHVIKLVHVAKWNYDREDRGEESEALYLDCAECLLSRIDKNGNGYVFNPPSRTASL